MIDQLHAFPDQATAEAVFPKPEGAEQAPCWLCAGVTVMPVQVLIASPQGPVPHPNYWMGVSAPDGHPAIEALWASPAAQVELERSEGPPVFWLSCVRRSRLRPEAAVTVAGVTPIFAGSSYSFEAKA